MPVPASARSTTGELMTEPQHTPLADRHEALGASFTDFGGWLMPVRYTSDLAEHHVVRNAVGLFDISHMAEFLVEGDLAGDYLDAALAGRLSTMRVFKAKYSLVLASSGGIVDDVIVYRLAAERFLVIANAGNRAPVWRALQERAEGWDVEVSDVSDDYALLAVQGPRAVDVLADVAALGDFGTPLAELPYYAATDGSFAGSAALVARTGYTGEDGFEIILPASQAVAFWDRLLGEGLAATGRISDAAMDRAIAALSICSDKLRRRHVTLARSVATEACRRASNGEDFINRVYRETGIALDVISAEEEARLAVLGCHILLEPGDGPALIFDIGGGSTELVLVDATGDAPQILDWQSVPWGVVSLTEVESADGSGDSDRLRAYANMRERVSEAFRPFAERVGRPDKGSARLLGTSGTVTTLASLHLELPAYDRSAIDGLIVPASSMRDISTRLSAMSLEERLALPCLGRERADLVVAGCAILESILDIWPAARLGVADRGIREGILRSLMAKELRERRALRR